MANGIPTQGVGSLFTLIKRLEAATSRLEDIAIAQTSAVASGVQSDSSSTPKNAHSPESSQETSPSIKAYEELIAGSLQKYLSLAKEVGGAAYDQAQQVQKAFIAQRGFLLVASSCQKPSSTDVLVDLLKYTSAPLNKAVEVKDSNRSDQRLFNGLTAVAEGISALGWVAADSKPGPMVAEAKDSAQFWVNRVIKDHKDSEPKLIEWLKGFVFVLEDLRKYIMQYHTTCLVWNPKGEEAAGFAKRCFGSDPKAASAPSPLPPPPPPPGPPPSGPPPPPPQVSDASSGASMDAVFASLNQGENITSSLRKVDSSQMTHKNPALRNSSGGDAASRAGSLKRPTKPPKPPSFQKKPAKTELSGNKWLIEFHEDQPSISLEDTEINQIVNIFGCKNCTIQIKGKVNAITLVSCSKTSVLFDSVVSSLSITSSPSFTVQVLGKCPTILIDATDGGQIYLSKDSLDSEIVTAKTSALNISLPSGDEEGVFEEKAIPEQIKSVVNGGRLVSTVLEHSS
ncbi:adenylate cyclase associated N terminal-domain-containing protein [Phakopsora pachyrhizi]|uniref:Adenylyl cyclase-associated protein n=1 Tax=Phakopsora pachyrhizi TaxID=170000 RepID=A0AAV0BQ48_PHAPC|nr:adenylate cyclase associated N terminal-domain-containing protein [Phakopsora pachyrhizi]